MKLSVLKELLTKSDSLNFVLPSGKWIPSHFHITEVGATTKHFIDCGGTLRTEKYITMQLWVADDEMHRLQPCKLLSIISSAETLFEKQDLEVEIEYQTETIGRYHLDCDGATFVLIAKHTDCLAKDNCGIPQYNTEKQPTTSCTPGGGCC